MSSFGDFVLLFQEYALLVAVDVPVLAVAGLDLFLALRGERGMGLLPTSMRFPAVGSARGGEPVSVASVAATSLDAANDEHVQWREVA